MPQVVTFDSPQGSDATLTGGKGANLGRLRGAGFDVPPGFVVTTTAYDRFVEAAGLRDDIAAIVSGLDYDDQAGVDSATAQIRGLIAKAPVPDDIATEIAGAYRALGADVCVAVRSSGTAEDLEGASFAGQHDTYLDVRGADAVVDAVQRCWASLWTPRATVYRNQNAAVVQSGVSMAVAVQEMVTSEVSGVMFTANPLTTATDEIVINASWGLGELVVQGAVTPDEFVVRSDTLTVLDKVLGTKESRMDRDAEAGSGSVVSEVAPSDQARYTLQENEIRQLAELGRRVQDHYGGRPQDIEWGFADGRFRLLQARPITGVEFSWDVDVEQGHTLPRDDMAVWSQCWAELYSGVVTPLTYSARFVPFCDSCYPKMAAIFGFDDLTTIRTFKYWKGGVYYNAGFEAEYVARSVWPALRPQAMMWIPPAWRDEVMTKPFSPLVYAKAVARLHMLEPGLAPYGFFKTFQEWRARSDVDGLTVEELRALTDRELVDYCERMVDLERQWADAIWTWSFYNFREGMFLLYWMLDSWYQGDTPAVFGTLLGGTLERTDTHREGDALRALAEAIRQSSELTGLFERHEDAAFFAACDDVGFLAAYEQFLADYGHRGHADRDMYYPRHADDPAVTYRALKMLLGSELVDAHEQEAAVNRRREEAFDDVVAKLRTLPLGALRVELFKLVFDFNHRNLLLRDNERCRPTDNITYAYKRGFVEIGRRVHERGLIGEERDFHFLCREELYDLLHGRAEHLDLLRTKIAGRARDCDRVLAREQYLPPLLQRNRELLLGQDAQQGTDGVYVGAPTSSGTVVGTARVIKSLEEIGSLRRGDILVVNATDPGWNPVFHVVAGVVVETGGNLSHASCLAREFGLPAVNLPGALRLLPDGASIEVNGNTGRITVLDEVAAG